MLVGVCFFLSGAAALILQVLWTRMLGHIFGATALAVSTTLTAFMGGLALGAWLGGRAAPKLARPVLAFAALETAVGLYGLTVPLSFEILPTIQRLIGTDLGVGFIGYSVLRFLIVAVILLLPTTAMGATLPILAEAVVKRGPNMASKVGRLYAANTFGAVAGALAAGFVLIPTFGIKTTILVAAGIDLLVAGTVVLLFRLAGGDRLLVETRLNAEEMLTELEPVEVSGVTPGTARAALLAFALSGAAAMSLEVLWTRTVSVVIGASTYAFTLILATFLIGLTGGAAAVTRRVDRIARPVSWLAWIQISVGVLATIGTALVDKGPSWLHGAAKARDATMGSIYATSFVIAGAVILPAALALGAVMPLVVRILAPRGSDHAGPIVARAYTLNTIGAIAGSFAGGFVLLPLLGVQRGLMIASMVSVGVGIMLALATRPVDAKPFLAGSVALVLILLMPKWDVAAWTAGLFRIYLVRNVYTDGWKMSGKIAYHRDGIASTVTVEQGDDGDGVSLKVNGKVDASDGGDMPTQILSGLLPLLVHDGKPEQVLVIGYGSGVTPGAVLEAPVRDVYLVEIEDAVYEASNRFFGHVNNRPWEDPRFHPVIDDGRNFLLTRDHRFDVIISEPSNPWMSGASSLFTRDFFELARGRLKEGGVFLQWLQLYELSKENIQALFRTFNTVFPHVLVFTPSPRSNDTLVVGSSRPLVLDRDRLLTALSDPKLKAELARAKVFVPEDFFGLLLLGTQEYGRFTGTGPINTDDNALIEFSAPKDLIDYSTQDADLPFLEEIEGKRLELSSRYFHGFDHGDPQQLATGAYRLLRQGRVEDATRFNEAARTILAETASTAASSTTSVVARADLFARLDRLDMLGQRLLEGDREPVVVATDETKQDDSYARSVLSMLGGHDREALRIADAEKDFEKRSTAHRYLYAYLCWRLDRDIDADYLMDGVLEDKAFAEANPSVYYYAARVRATRGHYDDAIDLLEKFLDAMDDD